MIYSMLLFSLLVIQQVWGQSIDMRTGTNVTHPWMETGFVYVNDAAWVTVTSIGTEYVQPVILTALPDLGGDTYTSGIPTATRIRNIVNNSGQFSFEVKLFQPNDSYCLKTWYTPQYLAPVEIGWTIAEYGAYNVTGYIFIIGTGYANRTHATLKNHTATEYHALDYPTGCGPYFNETCVFPQSLPLDQLGAVATYQTFNHETFLLIRSSQVVRRLIRIVVTPHDSSDPAYYASFVEPEVVGFMVFQTGIIIQCLERMTFETRRWTDVTSKKLFYPFHFTYVLTPAVFGMLISQNSLVDATALRAFNRSTSYAYVITQEDQCDELDPIHTTNETASAMVVGETHEGNVLCNVIYGAPTAAPTPSPACTYTFLLYDLFGDGWQNINLAIETDESITNYQVQCSCDMIQIVSQSCQLTIYMVSDGEAIAPWEPLWATIVGGQTWVGDFGTTMYIDHETVVVVNGTDTDPNSLGNQCKECTPRSDDDGPKPGPNPGPRPGDDDRRKRRGGDDRRKRRGGDDGRGKGRADDNKPSDDNKPATDDKNKPSGGAGGKGKDDDDCKKDNKDDTKCNKKRNLGAGDDGNHGTGLAQFTIYDQFGDGWYKGGGFNSGVCDSELCPNNDDTCVEDTIDLPDILTYPKWYVMNAARTKLVDFGSMCENPKGIEGCVISLPDGRYVFRVAGYNMEGDVASWRFCGIYGVNHQELQFEMINGKCVPRALLSGEDYCTGFKTLVYLSGSMAITGVTDDNLDDYDTNAIYLQLLAMFPNTVAVEIVSTSLSGGVLTVNFVIVTSPEDYGLDGSVSNNVETTLNSVYSTAQSESQSNFLTGLSTSILSSPTGAKDPLSHITGATLTSLEVVQVQYVKKDDNTVLHPLDISTSASSSSSSSSTTSKNVQNGISIMTIVALVCGVIFMTAATAFAIMRSRTTTHIPLSDKSSHLDTSNNQFSTGTSLDLEK